MISEFAYQRFAGLSTIAWLGIITYSSILFTALIPILRKKGILKLHPKWHIRFGITSIILATIHGALVIFS